MVTRLNPSKMVTSVILYNQYIFVQLLSDIANIKLIKLKFDYMFKIKIHIRNYQSSEERHENRRIPVNLKLENEEVMTTEQATEVQR